MLACMYLRACERRGYASEWIHAEPGANVGFREVTIFIRDARASEWLAAETGTHRLARVSPYGDSWRVARVLASVEVTPYPGADVDAVLREGDLDYELPKHRAGM
jgi:peptide chain release factor 2